MRTSRCPQCNKDFAQAAGRGRARKFCSPDCRYRSGRSAQEDASASWGVCSVPRCENKVRSARAPHCEMHYGRVRRYGSVEPTGRCEACGASLSDARSKFCDRVCKVLVERYRRYGLDPQVARDWEQDRDGKCDICSRESPLNIDHDHKTGEVRGLLCKRCNLGIGQFEDDPRILALAIEYLTLDAS